MSVIVLILAIVILLFHVLIFGVWLFLFITFQYSVKKEGDRIISKIRADYQKYRMHQENVSFETYQSLLTGIKEYINQWVIGVKKTIILIRTVIAGAIKDKEEIRNDALYSNIWNQILSFNMLSVALVVCWSILMAILLYNGIPAGHNSNYYKFVQIVYVIALIAFLSKYYTEYVSWSNKLYDYILEAYYSHINHKPGKNLDYTVFFYSLFRKYIPYFAYLCLAMLCSNMLFSNSSISLFFKYFDNITQKADLFFLHLPVALQIVIPAVMFAVIVIIIVKYRMITFNKQNKREIMVSIGKCKQEIKQMCSAVGLANVVVEEGDVQNAKCMFINRKVHIRINPILVRDLNKNTVLFIIGHELGHCKYNKRVLRILMTLQYLSIVSLVTPAAYLDKYFDEENLGRLVLFMLGWLFSFCTVIILKRLHKNKYYQGQIAELYADRFGYRLLNVVVNGATLDDVRVLRDHPMLRDDGQNEYIKPGIIERILVSLNILSANTNLHPFWNVRFSELEKRVQKKWSILDDARYIWRFEIALHYKKEWRF